MTKEYIDREAAKREFGLHFGGVSHAVIANRILDEIPTADVVEVVRCKDCKHYENHKKKVFENCVRNDRFIPMSPYDFCSYGERRDDNAAD